MSKALAFLRRDFGIQSSYRLVFLLEVIYLFLGILPYFFLGRFVGPALSKNLQQYGGDYFSFLLVGLIVQEYLLVPLGLFSRQIRESQLNGTLESLLSTQTSLSAVVLLSGLYPLIWATVNVALYILFAVTVFGVRFGPVNWSAAALVLVFALVFVCAIGILSASFILVFKRGDPLAMLINVSTWVFAGVLYPVSVLPSWLQSVSAILPIRYAIDGMRGALLQNASWSEIWPSLAALMWFAVVTFPIGLLTFHYANRWVRMTGSLSDY